jgi:hypothetical protein
MNKQDAQVRSFAKFVVLSAACAFSMAACAPQQREVGPSDGLSRGEDQMPADSGLGGEPLPMDSEGPKTDGISARQPLDPLDPSSPAPGAEESESPSTSTGKWTNVAAGRVDGDVYFEAKQWANAVPLYEQYLSMRPGEHITRYRLGICYLRLNKPSEAAEHLRLAHGQRPANQDYLEALSQALFAAERNDELFRILRSRALDLQTRDDWLRLGRYADKMKDRDTTLTSYLSAARVDRGRSWQPHVALYDHYRSMGQRAEAVNRLRMAYFVAPLQSEVTSRVKEAGVIVGPTFGLRPAEMAAPRVAPADTSPGRFAPR